MIYYIASQLTPYLSAFNVFSYLTVRAGFALLTGFAFCVLFGPRIIRRLQYLKVGQYIRQEHVHDLHALHKGKAGTPTMGGVIIIVASVLSLLLWSTLTNTLLIVATAVLVLMGAVGFLDDFIKMRRKHNHGLSARAKILGQIAAGTILGTFVTVYPITHGASYLTPADVEDWGALGAALNAPSRGEGASAMACYGRYVSPELSRSLASGRADAAVRTAVLNELNEALEQRDIYRKDVWGSLSINGESHALLEKGVDALSFREVVRLNRYLLEAAAPGIVAKSPRALHSKVGVPGIKDLLIPLGGFYVLFVILIIVGCTNAVNLTDGLDGLAAGASIISIFAFSGIAYVVSRADWTQYLYVMYVPEASELVVFGAALLGTGLGFLWFNAHPAEVFMGDTGSLALGGAIGTMAVLTKQELLLPIVGGLFVIEALSVIIQVISFKLTGRRVFRMAPLHHHFELMGWSESKVTIRFWILAMMFALLSLATLKLR